MGFIHEDHGRISIETRRESFIIHAGYGYVPGVFQLRDFAALGAEFMAKRDGADTDLRSWAVTLIAEDRIEAREAVSSVIQSFDPGRMVERPGFELAAEGPSAAWWREAGPPEFDNEDLDDLIEALAAVKDSR